MLLFKHIKIWQTHSMQPRLWQFSSMSWSDTILEDNNITDVEEVKLRLEPTIATIGL